VERISTQWPPLVSRVEELKLGDAPYVPEQKKATASRVAHALGGLEGERATEVLPALRTIKVDRLGQGASETLRLLRPFLVAREESGDPVVVVADVDSES